MDNIGIKKLLSVTATLHHPISNNIKKILAADEDMISIGDLTSEFIVKNKPVKVFVNGDWIGCCFDLEQFTHRYTVCADLPPATKIDKNADNREIYFWTPTLPSVYG